MTVITHRNPISTSTDIIISSGHSAGHELSVVLPVISARSVRCQTLEVDSEAGGLEAPASSWIPGRRWAELRVRTSWFRTNDNRIRNPISLLAGARMGHHDDLIAWHLRPGSEWARLDVAVCKTCVLQFEEGRLRWCELEFVTEWPESAISTRSPQEPEVPVDGPIARVQLHRGVEDEWLFALAGILELGENATVTAAGLTLAGHPDLIAELTQEGTSEIEADASITLGAVEEGEQIRVPVPSVRWSRDDRDLGLVRLWTGRHQVRPSHSTVHAPGGAAYVLD